MTDSPPIVTRSFVDPQTQEEVLIQEPVVLPHPAELPPKQEELPIDRKKPEEKASNQRKKPPNRSEEKASEPPKNRNTKALKFNGGGGRIHTEAHIDRILDEYILTGNLPTYVSDRQRYDYRHHIRLAERRQFLANKHRSGNQAGRTPATTGTPNNITPLRGTGTHDS